MTPRTVKEEGRAPRKRDARIARKDTGTRRKRCADLVTEHRAASIKIARTLLKRWGAWLEREEVESVCALALCEAASRYDPSHGTTFLSYSFYYLKGALVKTIAHNRLRGLTGVRDQCSKRIQWCEPNVHDEGEESTDAFEGIPDEHTDLERDTFRAELRECALLAFERLTELEREVIAGIHLLDFKVARLARSIGYSRGHISMVRRDAFNKVRPLYEPFRL